jgi:hypothetical protein
MTIVFPDVSNHNRGLKIQPGTVFVWAKASEGTTFKDDTYQDFKAQAAAVGAHFGAYHFLHAGNGAAQADFALSIVGPDVPLFIDVEPIAPNSYPTLADVEAFRARYRARGGKCWLMYYPKWYWSQQGSPSLTKAGLKLIASGYPAGYSDGDANWNPYGGLTPVQWQFSNDYEYAGLRVDFNAYKGTIEQFLTVIGAEVVAPPAPPITSNIEEDEMYILSIKGQTDVYALSGSRLWHVSDEASLADYKAAGIKEIQITPAELANIENPVSA